MAIRTFICVSFVVYLVCCGFMGEIVAEEDVGEEVLVLGEEEEHEGEEGKKDDVLSLEEIRVRGRSIGLGEGSFEEVMEVERGYSDVMQMLAEEVSVTIVQSSKGQKRALIRGFDGRQISFRFEDIPFDTGYDGLNGMDRLPMHWFGRGVIRKGSQGSMDSLGMGGGVAFWSKQSRLFEASLGLTRRGFEMSAQSGGELGAWRLDGSLGGQFSEGWDMSGSCKPSEYEDCGVRNNSDKGGGSVYLQARRALGGWGELKMLGGWIREARGVVIGVGTNVPRFWRYPNWDIGIGSVKMLVVRPFWSGNFQLWTTYQGNTVHSYDDASYFERLSSNSFTSKFRDFDFGFLSQVNSAPLSLGSAGNLSLRGRSELRYLRHEDERWVASKKRDSYEESKAERLQWDGRIGFQWKFFEGLELFGDVATIVAHDLSKTGTMVNTGGLEKIWSWKFDVGLDYMIFNGFKASIRAGRHLRVPTLKEQYAQVFMGASERKYHVKAEYLWDFQIQLDWMIIDKLKLALGGFDKEVRDLIEFRYVKGLHQAVNVGRVRMAGAEVAVEAGPFWGVGAQLSYAYLYAHDLELKKALKGKAAHVAVGRVYYQPWSMLKFGFGVQYESSRRVDDWTGTQIRILGDIWLYQAFGELMFEKGSVIFRVNNLMDINYSRSFGYPEEGRNYYLGVKLWY